MRPLPTIACLLALACFSGCAQTATLTVWQPAELDVSGIHRLAVLEFRGQGESGQIARNQLVTQFWQDGFYTLCDPNDAGPIAQTSNNEVDFSRDADLAVEVGRRVGADAVMVGEVIRYHADDDHRRERHVAVVRGDPGRGPPDHGPAGVGVYNNDYFDRDVSVAIAFRLIDVQTGQVRAENRSSYRVGGETINGQGYLPNASSALSELMARCARDIVGRVTPRKIPYPVELASPGFGSASSDIRRGNERAVQGDWEKAELYWNAALTTDPKNAAAMHNLALARAARFDYPRAVDLLTAAIERNRNEEYNAALDRLKRHQRDYDAVIAQRPVLTANRSNP